MGLSQPRQFFGVDSVIPYSRTDASFYGAIRVVKSSSLSLQGDLVESMGGSNKHPWAIEEGAIKSELSLKFASFEDFLFTLFLGKTPTPYTAETTGNCSTLTNYYGTSLMNATTGVASASVLSASETDLKFGKYTVIAASATTVHVYYSAPLDIGRGTNGTYQSDLLKITASALTILTSSATVNIPNFGLKLTGGSGTIALVTGDSATFEVRPINTGGMTVRIGGLADQVFPEFGCLVYGQKRNTGEMIECDIFRCKGAGMPLNFAENAWSEADVKVRLMYDSSKDGVFDLRFTDAA